MRVCYIDDAGCTGKLPFPTSPIQPVVLQAAVAFDLDRLHALTHDFLDLKARFFPSKVAGKPRLQRLKVEIKGADLRAAIRSGVTSEQRHATAFLDDLLKLVDKHHGRLFGRIWIKGIGISNDPHKITGSAMQAICMTFGNLLEQANDVGVVIADSSSKALNSTASFSIFTQKFKIAGDSCPRLIEMPVFGHSDNHAGIQIADLLCSALLFPLATYTYCTGHVQNVHVDPSFRILKELFGVRVRRLQHRYQEPDGTWRGGITVTDQLGGQHTAVLFKDAEVAVATQAAAL